MAVLKVVIASWLAVALIATPTVADVSRELARCQLEAERLYPVPDNKGLENWQERRLNEEKRAGMTETCMRAAGYQITKACSDHSMLTSVIYQDCMKIADDYARKESRDPPNNAKTNWYQVCLDNLKDRWNYDRLQAHCYQPDSWWRRWLGQ